MPHKRKEDLIKWRKKNRERLYQQNKETYQRIWAKFP